jgi:hypothetical protein
VQRLEPTGKRSFAVACGIVVKMKADMVDAPYVFERGRPTTWIYHLAYAPLEAFMPLAHEQLAYSRLPYVEREDALQVRAACGLIGSAGCLPGPRRRILLLRPASLGFGTACDWS